MKSIAINRIGSEENNYKKKTSIKTNHLVERVMRRLYAKVGRNKADVYIFQNISTCIMTRQTQSHANIYYSDFSVEASLHCY